MNSNDGRKVKRIWWTGINGDESKTAGVDEKLIFHNENHGDHDEDWVCLYDKSGNEIERYNARFISMIMWE